MVGALVLTVTSIGPALAQGGVPPLGAGAQPGSSNAGGLTAGWPGYGSYGYGSGFDYERNAYSYNRAIAVATIRSEEHTSELQSRFDLVFRVLLEKKITLRHVMRM